MSFMSFKELAAYLERLEATSKNLDMYDILADLFRRSGPDEIDRIIYITQGALGAPFHGIEIGMSEKLLIQAVSEASNKPTTFIEDAFRRTGDLGVVAEEMIVGKGSLSIADVYDELMSIARTSGKGSVNQKVNLLRSLLMALSPLEARYVARFVIGKLRLGVGDSTVIEALAYSLVEEETDSTFGKNLKTELDNDPKPKYETLIANRMKEEYKEKFGKKTTSKEIKERPEMIAELHRRSYEYSLIKLLKPELERAYNLCSDLGLVGRTLKQEGMEGIRAFHVRVGYPIRPALCERLPSPEDIIAKIGRAAVEAKYDGFRLQIHKDGDRVDIFSRNQERMTDMFPEITKAARVIHARQAIFEGEALVHNESTGELMPFQVTIQRKRKHGIDQASKDLPLKFFAFDLMFKDGEDCTGLSYEARRARLDRMIAGGDLIAPSVMFITEDPEEIQRFFEHSLEGGLEGVVVKRPDSPYAAGSRNFNWIKLKRSYKGELADSVDLCIVGYFAGKGQRTRFGIGAVLGAVYDPATDTFKSVSKVGTGFTDEEFVELKSMLDEVRIPHRHARVDSDITPDVWLTPRFVLTVTADEITRSPSHTAGRDESGTGYALRFPRAVGRDKNAEDATTIAMDFIRRDKSPEDVTTVTEIITLYSFQKKIPL